MNELKKYLIDKNDTIKNSMKKMGESASKTLVVVDETGKFKGVISDGDIRRHILNTGDLNELVSAVYNRAPVACRENDDIETIKSLMVKYKIVAIPQVDSLNQLINIFFWDAMVDVKDNTHDSTRKCDLPVVIMAGGKGTRMKPFTHILPKPLIPIGEKPIMDIIIGEFLRFDIKEYFVTLNFKGKMIEAYYNGDKKDFNLNYIWEEEYCGTAGALGLLKGTIEGTFIVSNCDIIVKADYFDVIDFHKKNNASMTVLSSVQYHKIPYGVMEYEKGGVVTGVNEKPEYTFTINTGVYVLESDCIDFIPNGEVFHMTDLLDALIKSGKTVVTYPVGEDDYIDVGQWEEYKNAVATLTKY